MQVSLPSAAPPPAWSGFRSLRVAAIERESVDVLSFVFEVRRPAPLTGASPRSISGPQTRTGQEHRTHLAQLFDVRAGRLREPIASA